MGSDTDGSVSAGMNRVALGLAFVAGAIAVLSLTAWVAGGFRLRPEAGLEATMPPDAALLILLLATQFHLAGHARQGPFCHRLRVAAVLLCVVAALASLLGHALAAKGFTWVLQPGIPRMPPLAGGLLFLISEGVLFSLLAGRGASPGRTAGAALAAAAWLAAVGTGLVECLRHPLDLQAGAAAQALLCAVCVFLVSTSLLFGAGSEFGELGLAPGNAAVALLVRGLGPAFMLVASVQAALGAGARLPAPDLGNAMACGFALASYLGAAVAVLWLMLRQTTDHLDDGVRRPGSEAAQPVFALPVELDPGSRLSLCRARSNDELQLALCEMLTEKLKMPLAWVASIHTQPPCLQLLCYSGEPAGMFPSGTAPVRWQIAQPEAFLEALLHPPWVAWDAHTPLDQVMPWLANNTAAGYSRGALLPIRLNSQLWGVLAVFDSEMSPLSESLLSILRRAADTAACVMGRLANGDASRELERDLASCRLRLQQVAAVIPGVMYQLRVGADGVPRYTHISPKAADYGLSTDPNHPDWRLGELIHPEDRNRFFEAVARSIMERKDFHFEGRALIGRRAVHFKARALISIQNEELVFDGILTEEAASPA